MANEKSLLGTSFDDYVSQQFQLRTRLLSTSEFDIPSGNITRDKGNLPFSLANTGFARLSSGVDIDSEEKALFFGKKEYQGNGLAKQFILQGGTLNNGALRGGVSGPNSAYTVGGIKDFGLRPMPGIESVSISSKGRWGSLREATVSIKCFNRDQLSIVETLYLRPGYTILLEWGHSLFYNNNNTLINNIRFIDVFSDGLSKDKIQEQIIEKRKFYSGNYDAFIGPVMNFNIRQNNDGSYNCIMKAVTWGSLIESLKINSSISPPNVSNTNEKSPSLVEDLNVLTSGDSTVVDKSKEQLDNSKLESTINIIKNTCNRFNDRKNHKIYIKDIYSKYYDTNSTGNSIISGSSNINSGSLTTFTAIPFIIASNNNLFKEKKETRVNLSTYMSLGSLLSIISKNCLLYSSPDLSKIPSPVIIDSSNNRSLIKIDFNLDTNFCYSPENHISIDPNVCLIRYDGSNFDQIGLKKENNKINPFLPIFKQSKFVGKTMNIMLNIDYILASLKSLETVSYNNDIILYDFIKKILSDISISLGKVNDFNISLDPDTDTLVIYDNQILENSPKELSIINTTGLKSSIRDITIDSKLSNELASTIAIGAQAGNSNNSGLDISALIQYNKDLKDRFLANKSYNNLPNNFTLAQYLKFLETDERAQYLKSMLEKIYGTQILIDEDSDIARNYYADIINLIKSKSDISTSILPFTFNIKMDGISGIKYGQMFSIEPQRLPKNYLNPNNKNQPLVGFLVTGIEHNIENQSWVTSISGQMAPIRDIKIK